MLYKYTGNKFKINGNKMSLKFLAKKVNLKSREILNRLRIKQLKKYHTQD